MNEMVYNVDSEYFVENKIKLSISLFKSGITYNGTPVKLKWGKARLMDDNGVERVVRIADYIVKPPMVTIDKTTKIIVTKFSSPIVYALMLPSVLFLMYGGIGGALGGANVMFIRNIFLTNNSMRNKILYSVISTVVAYSVLYLISNFLISALKY